jgi:hypothetical protein
MAATPYRVAPPVRPDPYLMAWADFRRRRTTVIALSLAYLPVSVVAVNLLGERAFGYVILPYLATFMLAGSYFATFRCPSCRNVFRAKPWPFPKPRPSQIQCGRCSILVGTPAPGPSDVRVE